MVKTIKKHCKTCSCINTQKNRPMHRKHTFRDTPSYINNDGSERIAVYICEKTIRREQFCWEIKEEIL